MPSPPASAGRRSAQDHRQGLDMVRATELPEAVSEPNRQALADLDNIKGGFNMKRTEPMGIIRKRNIVKLYQKLGEMEEKGIEIGELRKSIGKMMLSRDFQRRIFSGF